LFSIATGLRWSDCVKVKVGDFDIKNREYSIIQQKTNEPVPIIENELSRLLFQKYSKGKSVFQYLFPINCKKNDFTRQNYLTKVNEHLKEIGKILKFNNSVNTIRRVGKNPTKNPSVPFYQLISFHMGRRTHATIGAKYVDMKSISQQMGHSNITMTGKYISKDDDKLKTLFDFLKPKVSNPENPNSTPIDDDLKSQLSKLKLMFDEGLLSKEAYDDRVELLLDKYGFN
jgi:integrase